MERQIDPINTYAQVTKDLKNYFEISFDFYFKVLTDYTWHIKELENLSILSYWKEDTPPVTAAIVKKNGEPFVVQKDRYTLVVAIDCVKIGFVFRNEVFRENMDA